MVEGLCAKIAPPPIRSYAAQGLGGATRSHRSETEAFVVFGFGEPATLVAGFCLEKIRGFAIYPATKVAGSPVRATKNAEGGSPSRIAPPVPRRM